MPVAILGYKRNIPLRRPDQSGYLVSMLGYRQEALVVAALAESVEARFRPVVESFLARHGMAPTRFGKTVLNDLAFVQRLRAGRPTTLATIRRVAAWMAEYEQGHPATEPRPTKDAA